MPEAQLRGIRETDGCNNKNNTERVDTRVFAEVVTGDSTVVTTKTTQNRLTHVHFKRKCGIAQSVATTKTTLNELTLQYWVKPYLSDPAVATTKLTQNRLTLET